MEVLAEHTNEQQAEMAFTHQSGVFDELYRPDKIIQYKRDRVRAHVLQYLKSGSNILELNAGTGEDAVFFAGLGHHVHATDISSGMQQQLVEKVMENNLSGRITHEICSYTSLETLSNQGPYDYIFSNFAGLNCTDQLEKVLKSFNALLRPGGSVTLVVLTGFCLWESLLIFKGKFKTATRRLLSAKGADAKIDGEHFKCWYYSTGFITRVLKNDFKVIGLEGLCTIVPPSYIEGFGDKYPKLFSFLAKTENALKSRWPWRLIGDYYIISLKKSN